MCGGQNKVGWGVSKKGKTLRDCFLSVGLTLVSLVLGAMALLSSYWCEGSQKVPKPLCSANKLTKCIPVPGVSHNSTSIQFSWETGDDRFVFPAFHAGMWMSCEENIYTDAWGETLGGEHGCCSVIVLSLPAGMLWLSVSMELMYVGLLCISCVLLSLQLCLDAFWPSQIWGQLLNAYSAVFTILGGLLGMVAHMMFMQVFQTTASMGPEDFKPHSYGYSWGFYVAWLAFTCCMLSGVSTLNNYTKKAVMERRRKARLHTKHNVEPNIKYARSDFKALKIYPSVGLSVSPWVCLGDRLIQTIGS
uniref:Germ cell associated 1 n=1 Tax=Hucho hucho TaxID=62062 RepID=A0A4W5PJK1_9TELE